MDYPETEGLDKEYETKGQIYLNNGVITKIRIKGIEVDFDVIEAKPTVAPGSYREKDYFRYGESYFPARKIRSEEWFKE